MLRRCFSLDSMTCFFFQGRPSWGKWNFYLEKTTGRRGFLFRKKIGAVFGKPNWTLFYYYFFLPPTFGTVLPVPVSSYPQCAESKQKPREISGCRILVLPPVHRKLISPGMTGLLVNEQELVASRYRPWWGCPNFFAYSVSCWETWDIRKGTRTFFGQDQ